MSFVALRPTRQFRPDHIANDKDREFGGNGPAVDAWVKIFPSGSKIWATYHVRFLETGGGGTLFAGADTEELIDVGKKITQIRLDVNAGWVNFIEARIAFTDKNTSEDVVEGLLGGLINKARIQGDTNSGLFSGNDDPWIQFYFNPVDVRELD